MKKNYINSTQVFLSPLFCVKCENRIEIPRKKSEVRGFAHIKTMYCPICKEETDFVETKTGTKEEFYRLMEYIDHRRKGENMSKIKIKATIRSKECIAELLAGNNPFTNERLENDSIIIDEKLIACFTYINDILDIVIAKHNIIDEYVKKSKISITAEIKGKISLSEAPILISDLIKRINNVLTPILGVELGTDDVIKWLIRNDILRTVNNRTELGRRSAEFGIINEFKENKKGGKYCATVYSLIAQKYIVENINEILLLS